MDGVMPSRRATDGSGMTRATSVAGATSCWSACTDTPAIALMTTRSAGKRSSASTLSATCGRTHTITTGAPSTTAWLSAATSTVGKRCAKSAAFSALRGESSTSGASSTSSHKPVTIAAAIAPTPITP